ncbi:hypothetical protein KIW84_070242, partial [Lathyrus oleraceus]
ENSMNLIVFLVLSLCITSCKIDAKNNTLLNGENHFTRADSLIKIQHQLHNDFDCVDIYKQPSLQNPLLKNHKIQLYPTFANNIMQSKSSYSKIVEGCSGGKSAYLQLKKNTTKYY